MDTNISTFSITDLRQNTLRVLNAASQAGIAYLVKHSKPHAAVVDINYLQALQEAYEDYLDTLEFDRTVNLKRVPLKSHKR